MLNLQDTFSGVPWSQFEMPVVMMEGLLLGHSPGRLQG